LIEEKQERFLERQKERLFGLVDNLDYIKKVGQGLQGSDAATAEDENLAIAENTLSEEQKRE